MPELLAEVPGLEVRRGDVVLLRGPNGSGKTSLLRALAGLPPPLAQPGVRVLGQDPVSTRAARLRGAYATQEARDGLVGLTVRGEFALRDLALPEGLRPVADQAVATLSSGQARRVALAACGDPRRPLLLLDEPVEGLDAAGRASLLGLVRSHAERGAVVAADHSGTLASVATRILDLGAAGDAAAPPLPPPGREPVLRVPSCTPAFVERRLPAFALPAGMHAVTGPNGAGKSTLLRAIAGLLPGCAATVGDAPVRPGGNLRLLLPHAKDTLRGETLREALGARAVHAEAWGLAGLLGRHPLSLSGGEAQRAALAKALAPAQVHLLDEPEAHLDAGGRTLLWAALAGRVAAGACVLVATHDPTLLAACHSRIALEAA